MKVLIISDAWHPQVNGVVRTYEHIVYELEKKNIHVTVIGPQDFPLTMPMPFYPEIRLVISPYRRLKHLIEAYAPDHIHIATEGPLGWAARRYCLRNKRAFVTSFHTQFPDYVAKRFAWLIPPLYNAVHRFCIQWVRTFHAPSKAILIATPSLDQQLRNWGFKIPMARMTRGVDTAIFYPGEKNLMRNLPKPIALYVGRIAIEKNLEAFLDMPWNGSKVLVGNGPILYELREKYKNAHFVGKKSGRELADYYRSSDVFVFPSRTDTFGIVLIEALACGLPVAGFNVTGPKDIITQDYMGALEETDLANAALRAIKQVDPAKCAAHIQENYSWAKVSEQFLSAL